MLNDSRSDSAGLINKYLQGTFPASVISVFAAQSQLRSSGNNQRKKTCQLRTVNQFSIPHLLEKQVRRG